MNETQIQMVDQRYSFRYLVNLVMRRRDEFVVANVIAVFATLASVPVPLLMPLLVDEVLLDTPGKLLAAIQYLFPSGLHTAAFYVFTVLVVTLVLRLISWVLTVWQTFIFYRISKDVIFKIRRKLLRRLGRVSIAEYESSGSGTISAYLVNDLNTLDSFIGSTVSRFLISVFTIIATTVVLLFLHWQLALFLLLLNPIVIYFTMLVGKRVKTLKRKENKAIEVFQQAIIETLSMIQQIRASNRDQHYVRKLIKSADTVRKHATTFAWKNDAAGRFSFLIFLIGFDLFRAIGMMMVVVSDLSIGEMIAVFGYLWFMLGPIQEVLGMQYAWFGAKAALERINRINTYELEPTYPQTVNPFVSAQTSSIEVDDLCLAYDGNDILRHIHFNVAAGEKVALVGASGGGKTTFVHALLGLYPGRHGRIAYNHVPIERIGLEIVRENIGCVLQHPMLFNGTIRDNLTLGREVDDHILWRALEIAQLAEFIKSKPKALSTIVGVQGLKLSGGQRQRLAIARILLTDPKVIILDEATSAIDYETEKNLYRDLFAYLKDKTVLIVAHRLSAVSQANRVYVFENGNIIEHGEHTELIEKDGLYARMFATQL